MWRLWHIPWFDNWQLIIYAHSYWSVNLDLDENPYVMACGGEWRM